VRQVKCNW